MIKNVSFTEADITSFVNRGGMNVITINLTTSHGIVEGHNVYLTIMTNAKTGTITVSSVNTVVTGDDTDKYKLGTEWTINALDYVGGLRVAGNDQTRIAVTNDVVETNAYFGIVRTERHSKMTATIEPCVNEEEAKGE